MIPVKGLNHAVLYVRNLERSLQFYQALFGFTEVARMGDRMAFLRAAPSNNHHDLGLMALGDTAPLPQPGTVGLYHLAWEVPTRQDLLAARVLLQQVGCLSGASDHGASQSLYAKDPDGNEFEIMWQVPRSEWGEYESKAITRSLNLTSV